ncbi:MAG: DNA methyltransferase [Candidatus Nanogingivalis sp.]
MAAKLHNELAEIPTEERDMDEIKDGYQLKFVGKDYAKLQAGLKTETIITPDFEHNDKPENQNSENIFITGDNLDALKHLENAYSGKIDVIYIDPPYNTGNDGFVYADNFKLSDEDLKEKLGLTDTEISRVRALNGKSSHSAWLTFILPRLMIAKRLLSDAGVIFISIDDNEQSSLKSIMDEIFGEQNLISNTVVKGTGNDDGENIQFQNIKEYLLIYGKRRKNVTINKIEKTASSSRNLSDAPTGFSKNGTTGYIIYFQPKTNELIARTDYDISKLKDNNPDTFYTPDRGLIKEGFIPVTPIPRNGDIWRWRWSIDEFNERKKEVLIRKNNKGRYVAEFIQSGNNSPKDVVEFGTGTGRLKKLFDSKKSYFDNPKSTELLNWIVSLATNKNSLILDFFAGSSTTADAVMQLNAEDGGSRKFILVQLPETVKKGSEAEKAGYKTIDQISRERIIRAAAKIGDKSGFKHFRLTTPEDENSLLKMEEFDPNANVAFPEDMTTSFNGGEEAILQTWLIDDGFEFNQKPKVVEFDGYKAHFIENRLYLIATGWSSDATRELLNRIGKNKLAVQTIVIFPYSFSFNELNELKTNLRTAFEKSNKIEVLERY